MEWQVFPVDRKNLLIYARGHRLAVQASVSAVGAPQAAVIGVAITDDFEIVFDTLSSSRKMENLRANAKIALVIGGLSDSSESTVQLEGIADEPYGDELTRLREHYFKVFPDGRERLSWPGITYVRVRPIWIRYSDYATEPPTILELKGNDLR